KLEAKANRSQLKTKGVGAAGNQDEVDKSFKGRQEVVATTPVHTQKEANDLALQTLERIAKDLVKGTASTVGLPDLRAGSVVIMEDLGNRFSGRYFVTATTHTISDAGYTTQFDGRRA